jgi:hypothetical protein
MLSTKPPAGLDANGCGMLKYPNGTVCVNVVMFKGNKEFYFYDSSGDGNKILGKFSQGVGFIQFPSGVQRCMITNKGGRVCNDKGNTFLEWPWQVHGKRTGPKKPIDFKMNNNLTFYCIDQQTIFVELRLTGQSCKFQLGRKYSDKVETFSDMMVSMKKKGPLNTGMADFFAHTPSLVDRYVMDSKDIGTEAIKRAQAHNWALPQISAR